MKNVVDFFPDMKNFIMPADTWVPKEFTSAAMVDEPVLLIGVGFIREMQRVSKFFIGERRLVKTCFISFDLRCLGVPSCVVSVNSNSRVSGNRLSQHAVFM